MTEDEARKSCTLSEAQLKKLSEHLPTLLSCQHKHLSAQLYAVLRLVADPTLDTVGEPRPAIACVVLGCEDCGLMRLLNAKTIGLFP